jgi:benzoate-CoA ligase
MVIQVEELPKTATGKIQRYRLRAKAKETTTPPATTATDLAEAKG